MVWFVVWLGAHSIIRPEMKREREAEFLREIAAILREAEDDIVRHATPHSALHYGADCCDLLLCRVM
jgi:hypothetical protein